MSHFGEGSDDDVLSAHFMKMAADLRHELAVEARAAGSMQRQMAHEEAKFAGLLRDVAERGVVVVVDTINGRRHRGAITAVGKDYCVVEGAVITDWAVASVLLPGAPQPPSSREVDESAQRFEELLTDYAAQRFAMRVWVEGVEVPKAGELVAVGDDVITLSYDSQTIVVPIDRITEVTLG